MTAQFATNAIGTSTIVGEDYADSIANLITNEISRREETSNSVNELVDGKVDEIRAEYSKRNRLDEEKIAEKYAAIMGYQVVGKEVYTDVAHPVAKNVGNFFGTLSGFFSKALPAWDPIATLGTGHPIFISIISGFMFS